jgi:hypothetical protein
VSNDFEEFEAQMEGVEDPSPFAITPGQAHHGREICEALNDVTNWMSLDLAEAMNQGKPGIVQYLNRSNGATVTVAAMSARKLVFAISLAADDLPFIDVIAVPIEDPGSAEPETFDPDKDNG